MEQRPSDTHYFDVTIAKEYGVPAAIVINHLQWWLRKNKALEKHQHDGHTWTYNTIKASPKIWPYWTTSQIRKIFDDLAAKGIILKSNYNTKRNDQTMWYAFADESAFLAEYDICEKTQMACAKGQMDLLKNANGFAQKGKCIRGADNNQINIPVKNKETSQLGLSGKAEVGRIDRRIDELQAEQKCAEELLLKYGVDKQVANEIIHLFCTPPNRIEEVIKNGLARQLNEPGFVLQAGYIVASLNGAREEGKIIKPTKFSREMAKTIARKNSAKPLSPAEFMARKKQITESLKAHG